MSGDGRDLERLREHFAPVPGEPPRGPDCLSLERIWDAASGALPRTELRRAVDHASACEACASAWRMAVEANAVRGHAARRDRSPRVALRWVLVAAMVVGAVAIVPLMRRESTPPIRSAPESPLRSLLMRDARLPRDGFLLRWTDAGAGALYTVDVSDASLSPLHRASGLVSNAYRVPSTALDRMPSGAQVFWRVEALLPDGRIVATPTEIVTLE